jgi:hypothetical protein
LENCAGWRAQSIMTEKVLEGKEDFMEVYKSRSDDPA